MLIVADWSDFPFFFVDESLNYFPFKKISTNILKIIMHEHVLFHDELKKVTKNSETTEKIPKADAEIHHGLHGI